MSMLLVGKISEVDDRTGRLIPEWSGMLVYSVKNFYVEKDIYT